jgi:hypothetical protein
MSDAEYGSKTDCRISKGALRCCTGWRVVDHRPYPVDTWMIQVKSSQPRLEEIDWCTSAAPQWKATALAQALSGKDLPSR